MDLMVLTYGNFLLVIFLYHRMRSIEYYDKRKGCMTAFLCISTLSMLLSWVMQELYSMISMAVSLVLSLLRSCLSKHWSLSKSTKHTQSQSYLASTRSLFADIQYRYADRAKAC